MSKSSYCVNTSGLSDFLDKLVHSDTFFAYIMYLDENGETMFNHKAISANISRNVGTKLFDGINDLYGKIVIDELNKTKNSPTESIQS